MHKITSVSFLAAALLGLSATSAMAGTTGPQSFNVTVALTSQCTVAVIPDLNFGTYTAFTVTPLTASTSVGLTCTRGVSGTMTPSLDAPDGVVAGLNYAVAVGALTYTSGTAATANGTGAPNGTPDTYSYSIDGSIAAGQAGDAGAPVTEVRTITFVF